LRKGRPPKIVAFFIKVSVAKKEIKKKLRNAQRLQDFAVVTNRPGGGLAMI